MVVLQLLLCARLKGRGPLSSRPVNGKKLDDDFEEGLHLHNKRINYVGFPLQPEAIEAYANRILARNHGNTETEPAEVG